MSADFNDAGYYSQPERGKSGGSKVWMFLGIGCGVSLLLCCGGAVVLFFTIKKAVNTTQVPAEVAQHASDITDFDVPAGFTPQGAFMVKVPFTGQKIFTIVAYSGQGAEGGIFLMEMGQFGGDANLDNLQQHMEEASNRQDQQVKRLTVLSTRDLTLEIRGQPATFKIQKAEDPQSKQQYIQVIGTFRGKQGQAILMGQLNADEFNEEDAEKLARSIK